MKWIHPNASHAASFAALAVLLGIGGCRNQSGGIANPFLAPDRVPPPATRAILPGQAQPYYPGDPLPVMQSRAEPFIDGSGLAWNGPDDGAPVTPQPAKISNAAISTAAMVAIPTDNDSLRFALSAAAEPASITPAEPSPLQFAADAREQDVLQTSYSEPTLQRTEPAPNPWRQPQIDQPAIPPPPPVVQLFMPQPTPPFAATPNEMDVRLRAVASPPPQPGEIPSPRIRFSGDVVPQTASHDGFRPRSSKR